MRFRPCIDLHNGVVKQIVGGTLTDDGEKLVTNFRSPFRAGYYALKFREDNLTGGHIIILDSDPLNAAAAVDAFEAWPNAFQLGGGMNPENASGWLDRGASAIIVTSYVFRDGHVNMDNLARMAQSVGRDKLVLDLSCRKRDGRYYIVTNRWQKFTDVEITEANLDMLSRHCFEFLVHAADIEGLASGIDTDLVKKIGGWDGIPITYAGGIRSMEDVLLIKDLSGGRLDFTVGSALDLYGGKGIKYADLVAFNSSDERIAV